MANIARSGEVNACLFLAIHLSVDHPLFDCIPIKTIVVADLERRNLTFANHSIDRGPMNFQKLGYFGNRHDAAGRGIVAGFHCASAAAWREFILLFLETGIVGRNALCR